MDETFDVVLTGNEIITIDQVEDKTELALKLKDGIQPELQRMLEAKGYSFDGVEPFFWFAEISNDIPNCYFLIFEESMQKDWTKALEQGVQYQLFHENSAPIGHSVYGWSERADNRYRTLGAFYAIPGTQINQYMSTDSFMQNLKTGVFRDVSVGMHVQECNCSICGAPDVLDFWAKLWGESECPHFLGERYNAKGEPDPKGKQICYGRVPKGDLSEVSQVYDGGAPLASVVPALSLSREKGLLDRQLQARLEHRFGMNSEQAKPEGLSSAKTVSYGGLVLPNGAAIRTSTSTSNIKGTAMAEPAVATVSVSFMDTLDARHLSRLAELEVLSGENDEEMDLGLTLDALFEKYETLEDRNKSLEADAAIGRSYKTQKIEDAIAEGVRAKGNDFKSDIYKAMLANADIDHIKQVEADFKAEADARRSVTHPNGTRLTTNGSDPTQLDDVKKARFNDPRYGS